MTGDRRHLERVPILGSLPGEITVDAPMAVKELGLGGLTVETSFPLQLDSLHELRLSLGAVCVLLRGRVVNSSITDVNQDVVIYRSGLEFVEMPERATAALDEYIASLKAGRTGA